MREYFIKIYSEIHLELNELELEIDKHLKDKLYLVDNGEELESLRKRTEMTIELLEKTREEERKMFNYGS